MMGYYRGGALMWSEFIWQGLGSPSKTIGEMMPSLGDSASYSKKHLVNTSTAE